MAFDLAKAISSQVTSDTTLKNLISDSSGQLTYKVFAEYAPQDVAMPYIVYYFIANAPVHCFDSDSTYHDYLVQFSLFTDDSSSANISTIRDSVYSVFNRKSLTYDSKTAVGCLMENEVGPARMTDAWQWTMDFAVKFHD